jgi:predicted aspartyl protease
MASVPLIVERDQSDPDCANVLVDGTVGGVRRRFILDTGAARSALVASDDLKLEPCGVETGSGGVFEAVDHQLASVRDLRVGPFSVDRLTVSLAPHGAPHNLLGMDVLGESCWRLSLLDAKLTLESDLTDRSAHDLYVGPRGHPYVDVAWDAVTVSACWDTGAGITVVDAGFAKRHSWLFTDGSSSRGTDSTGATRETPTFLMQGPTIGGHRFESHRVAVVDLSAANAASARPMDLILGFTTLTQAEWVMDFPSRRWSATIVPST